jgi:hypothetical protein
MAEHPDPYRPSWTIQTPAGSPLTAEFDRLRNHWRVTPGEYVRRNLADALAQATGSGPDTDWIVAAERELSTQLKALK